MSGLRTRCLGDRSTEIGVHSAYNRFPSRHPRFSIMSFQQPTPFTINISDSLLKQTQEKLRETRFPDQLQNVTWEGPSPLHRLRKFRRIQLTIGRRYTGR